RKESRRQEHEREAARLRPEANPAKPLAEGLSQQELEAMGAWHSGQRLALLCLTGLWHDVPEGTGQRPGPVRLAQGRVRLRRLVSLRAPLRPRPLPQAPAAALPPRRDAAGGPGPGRLGTGQRRRYWGRPPDVVRLRAGAVALAQGGGHLVPAHRPAE